MDFVFIIGIARTGSKIYMTSLNGCSEIDLVNEMHFLAPRYIREDAASVLGLDRSPLTSQRRIDETLDKMYSGTINGTFWDKREPGTKAQQRLVDIDRTLLAQAIESSDGSTGAVFRALLESHATAVGKRRAGAKFPVDISRVNRLVEWFPDARFVHLIRDPRAIYSSMIAREIHTPGQSRTSKLATRLKRLSYVILQYKRAAKCHELLGNSPKYFLSRFEDMTALPEIRIRKLCDFLDVRFSEDMLSIRRVDSSYTDTESVGIEGAAATRWQQHLTSTESKILEWILSSEMRKFGY